MKHFWGIVLLLVMVFAISKETKATTVVMLGRIVDSSEEFHYDGTDDLGDIDGGLIGFTYVKKIRFTITNQVGEFNGTDKDHMESLNIQVGYPLYSDNKGLLYLTLTGIKYSGYEGSLLTNHEADGGLFGFEIIGTPSDKVQFELGWHKDLGGSYRINNDSLPLDLMMVTFKIHYLLTDNLGLVIYCESKDFNNRDITLKRSEAIYNTVFGFVYRI